MAGSKGRAQYTPDKRGMGKYLRSRPLRTAVRHRADQVAVLARMRLPKDSGHLAASVEVVDTDETVGGSTRVGARVIVTADYAAAVEFGTKNTRNAGTHIMHSVADALTQRKRRI